MTNLLRMNPNAKHLNEMAHRHSFNESIYSEPYGGRYVAGNQNSHRLESNPLSESASASNIYSGKVVTATRNHPQYYFPQQSLSHRDVYGTNSSIASSNGFDVDANSTRSSVYSDRTILNEQTPPSTPRISHGDNEQFHTNNKVNPNSNSTASNESGSQATLLQSKPILTNTEQVQTLQSHSISLDKSSLGADGNSGEQSEYCLWFLADEVINNFFEFVINSYEYLRLFQSLKKSTKLQRL